MDRYFNIYIKKITAITKKNVCLFVGFVTIKIINLHSSVGKTINTAMLIIQ